jgi:hypothetical protein
MLTQDDKKMDMSLTRRLVKPHHLVMQCVTKGPLRFGLTVFKRAGRRLDCQTLQTLPIAIVRSPTLDR